MFNSLSFFNRINIYIYIYICMYVYIFNFNSASFLLFFFLSINSTIYTNYEKRIETSNSLVKYSTSLYEL